ncbi:MAG: hypothetical protein IJX66_06815 [Lachnospiraceae bacterium]|nr:hypothetical protein [Lachnospiraceae bacterium]
MDRIKKGMTNFLKKHVSFNWYIVVFIGISLIPLLWIGRYNVMSADDYSMGKECHLIWEETKSILSMLKYAFVHTWETYSTWQGCFTLNFFDSLNPAFFGEHLAWVTPIIMLSGILISTYLFVKAVILKYYDSTKKEISIVWGILVVLIIQTMPSPVEGLYWYSGAIAYTFWHFLMLLLFSLLFHIENKERKSAKVLLGIVASVYAFLVGGCQYITVLECLLWYAVFLLLNIKELKWWKIMPGLTLLSGFLLNLLAPGNAVRQQEAIGMSPIAAIMHSFIEAIRYMRQWMSPLLVVAIFLLVPFIWEIVKKQRKNYVYKYPLVIWLGSFCLFAAAFTPSLYGVGNVDAGRIQNLIQSIFYILVLIDVFYFIGWLQVRTNCSDNEFFEDFKVVKNVAKKYQWIYKWIAFAVLILVVFGTADKNTFSSVSALRSLVIGEAQTYHAEAQERLAIYKDEDIQIAEVQMFSVKPHVLYFADVVEESNYWINENIAEYYGKEKVVLLTGNEP